MKLILLRRLVPVIGVLVLLSGVYTALNQNVSGDDEGESIPAVDISAGSQHVCALLDTGNAKCWGANYQGQLGQGHIENLGDAPGEMGDNLPPIDLGTGRTVVQIAKSCALLDNRAVKCWGSTGLLGLSLIFDGGYPYVGGRPGEMGDNLPPIDLGTGRTAVEISSGGPYCARLDDGTVKCWGYNGYGQLGQGHTDNLGHSPGYSDRPGDYPGMGDNLPPIDLGTGRTAVAIAGGTHFACAVLDNGTVKCWGRNEYGQLGQGHTNNLGDDPGEMGDNLPPIDLGIGRTALQIGSRPVRWCKSTSSC